MKSEFIDAEHKPPAVRLAKCRGAHPGELVREYAVIEAVVLVSIGFILRALVC